MTEHSFHPFLKGKSSNESEGRTYNAVGDVATKKDNRQITIYFTYDALDRLTQKTYSDSTPPVSYSYDTAGVAYAIGRLTQMASNGIYSNTRAFDPLGNVTAGSHSRRDYLSATPEEHGRGAEHQRC